MSDARLRAGTHLMGQPTWSDVNADRSSDRPGPADGRMNLETIGLTKSYGGVVALDAVDFTAHGGEIHGLVGENGAGKSTFIKILAGVVRPNAGAVRLQGAPLSAGRWERRKEVAAVFQELSLVPDLTVAQNVWLGQEPVNRVGAISARTLHRKTIELFDNVGVDSIDPKREVRLLSMAERHLVEMAKALSTDPRVIIFDETTSALGPKETDWLLSAARAQAAKGRIVLFISHRLAEVRDIADRITVFRSGKNVGLRTKDEYDEDDLVTLMLARRLERYYPDRATRRKNRVALGVRGVEDGHKLRGVDLDLHEGEILGLGGLQGQGQAELFLALYGAHPVRQGAIEVMGERVRFRNIRQALRANVALVPEDRRNQGLLLTKSVRENITLAVVSQVARFGVIRSRDEKQLVDRAIAEFRIVARNQEQQVQWLSGGNQQKVVIAKFLLTKAKILLLFDVTRGVDVGTKEQIFTVMDDLAQQGYAMLFYSTDASELANMADRVAVMSAGRIVATLTSPDISEEDVVRAAVRGEMGRG